MIYLLSTICVILALALLCTLIIIVRLSRFIFELEDSVEESLDILDERYRTLCQILQINVIADDPIVKNIIFQVKQARDCMLEISNKIISFSVMKDKITK